MDVTADKAVVNNGEVKKMFLNPRYVFLPVKEGYRVCVKDGEYIYKNDIAAMNKDDEMIYSSVSGRVLGIKEMPYFNNKIISSIVIENDFKENIRVRKSARRYLSNISKENFINVIADTSLTFKDLNLEKVFNRDYSELIINGIDKENEFKNKYHILSNYADDILETVDIIGDYVGASKIVFALRNNLSDIISNVVSTIGTYPNIEIKLINGDYANSLDPILAKNLGYNDALVLSVDCVYKIFEALKRETPVSTKFLSITGPGVNYDGIIEVKYGCLLSEVFVTNFDFTSKNVDVYLNGPIGGFKVNNMKIVVDDNIDGIYVEEKQERHVEACISCGLCSKECPMKLNPKYVFDHKGRVKEEYTKGCLQCGLCNHVCPSNIDLRRYMRGDVRE